MSVRLAKIISGGQTGADQGALDAALLNEFPVGGWCPHGRRTEDGLLPPRFSFLVETPETNYVQRTAWNVRDSDGTLMVHKGSWGPGTRKTADLARGSRKPFVMIDIRGRTALDEFWSWLLANDIACLNVAGPRESGAPGMYESTRAFIAKAISRAVIEQYKEDTSHG